MGTSEYWNQIWRRCVGRRVRLTGFVRRRRGTPSLWFGLSLFGGGQRGSVEAVFSPSIIILSLILGLALALAVVFIIKYRREKHRRREIEFLIDRDARTGLWDPIACRNLAEERLAASPAEQQMALLVIDIDDFKSVNDTYGHAMGDCVLERFGILLREIFVREDEVAGRWGGDEFMVLLPDFGEIGAVLKKCELLRQKMHRLICRGKTLQITLSIGIALAGGGESFDLLFQRADKAMYRTKRSGRDGVLVDDGKRESLAPGLPEL